MIAYLIDTNVVSKLDKPRPDPNVRRWFEKAAPEPLFASVVTLGEIRLGIESLSPGKCRSDLERSLEHGLPDWFASNLLPVTDRIADRWARITVQARRSGLHPTTTDGMIAATALEHRLTLVTRNVKDFTFSRSRSSTPGTPTDFAATKFRVNPPTALSHTFQRK